MSPRTTPRYSSPREEWLVESRQILRDLEARARYLRKVIAKVENPPDDVTVEFSFLGVRFVKQVKARV